MYIHDKSFYSDSEVDPHQESMEDYVVQHITVENFKHQSSAAVYNILKELVIKRDIATGRFLPEGSVIKSMPILKHDLLGS